MASELVNVSDLGMKEEELFSRCDSNIDSEKITAPRYSYWHSVFRVFFKKKINIVVLAILAFIIIFSYIYPIFSGYDAYANLLDSTAKHLSPAKAIDNGASACIPFSVPAVPASPLSMRFGTVRRFPSPLHLSAHLST